MPGIRYTIRAQRVTHPKKEAMRAPGQGARWVLRSLGMHDTALSLLRDYIAIPSVNPMGRDDLSPQITGEARYAERVARDLTRLGLDHVLLGDGDRRSVYAEARATGARDTVVIASHLDTVPVDGMTIPAFDPRVTADRVHGRGSTDTKGGLAAAIAALERVLSRGKLKRNVIIAGQADEEMSSVGAFDLLGSLAPSISDRAGTMWAIATEPTELRIVTHHKGVARLVVSARGVAAHSSDPAQGDNAILRLCRGLLALDRYASTLTQHTDPLLGSPTLSVGTVRGGRAPNIVPDAAHANVDRRMLPGETEHSVTAEFVRALGDPELAVDCHIEKPPLGLSAASPAVLACAQALTSLGLDASPAAVAFGTDAGLFDQAGVPCVVMGPGSIRQAHTQDEYLDVSQLEAMTRFFTALFGQ